MKRIADMFPGIIICIIIVFTSCDKNDDLSPLPEKILISLAEKYYPDSSQIILKIESEEEYPCSNFEIIYSSRMSGSKTIIEFEGITNHGFCHTALGPAKATVVISNGIDYDNHLFDFTLNENNDSFDFEIKETEAVINPDGNLTGNIIYEFSTLKRLQEFTNWGYTLNKHEGVPENRHLEFYSEILDAGAVEISLEDGFYGFFIIDNGDIIFNNNDGNITPLVFVYEGSLNDICEIATEFNEDLSVFLKNTKGEQCESN